MVIRPNQHWFFRLFDWHGSVLSKIIFRLCLNIAMSIIAILVYQWYELLGIHLTVAPFSLLVLLSQYFLVLEIMQVIADLWRQEHYGEIC